MLLVGDAQRGTAAWIKVCVVITCYEIFVRVRQGGVVINGSLEFCRSAMVGYVASVNKNVTVWNVAWIERVGV